MIPQHTGNSTTPIDQFASLDWYDKLIEFIFRFTAKTSEPLLAAGIVYSAADVLSRGHIGSNSLLLSNAWALTQSVAIESSGGVVLVYGIESIREKDKVKAWLYLILSMMLALAGGIMLFMQLAGWENQSDSPFMLTLFALRCIVSIGYIYLCRTKNIRFTGVKPEVSEKDPPTPLPEESAFTLEDVRLVVIEVMTQIKEAEAKSIQVEEQLQLPEHTESKGEQAKRRNEERSESFPENFYRVQDFLVHSPNAKIREVATALGISMPTANKWMHKVREKP
jgi:uncharacterized membrane protein